MFFPTFAGNNHPLSDLVTEMEKRFIPPEGPTAYIEAELLRACNRISWDYFNNGFGNDMSHAVAYIDHYHAPVATPEFLAAWKELRQTALREEWIDCSDTVARQITLVTEEILLRLDRAAKGDHLTPIGPEMFDMPREDVASDRRYLEEDDLSDT
ncbi:hypothetical protein [Sphingomonas sp. 3-13AW]|uniref:hypothetical protein n=1 Tax=Sphingomonas sp. 3-13AW TaxID=3050450 RepID=UPI003BB5CA63